MLLFSPRIRAICIVALASPLCSETFFIKPAIYKYPTVCNPHIRSPKICTKEYVPVCATNGRTFYNICSFCVALKESGRKFTLAHYGKC